MIKVLLVDDHALMREMLAERLGQEESMTVVGQAPTASEAMALANDHQPDVIVMDIDMPGLICFDAARRIQKSLKETRFLFLSAYTHDHYIEQALQVGALGYLTKSEPSQRVVEAIAEVAANRVAFSHDVQERIVFDQDKPRLLPRARSRASTLTPREVEVLRYVSRGLSKKEIAATMFLSVKTVEKHTDNLMHKLSIHDRVELARFAIREGLAES